jgi:GNAT superfamily N-acetyltransferase
MFELRMFKPEDLEALYAISLATGLAGDDASKLYNDKKLIGHIYSAPYALLEPGLAMVVVDGQGVGGFVVGTHDTNAWESRLDREWWPKLRALYKPPADTHGLPLSSDQRRISMIFNPERTPERVVELYPAHLHMNLLPRLQNKGVGSTLLANWLTLAQDRGVEAVHIGANRANANAIRFWRGRGFDEIPTGQPEGRTLWMGHSKQVAHGTTDSN